jgi:hypothetical protein
MRLNNVRAGQGLQVARGGDAIWKTMIIQKVDHQGQLLDLPGDPP